MARPRLISEDDLRRDYCELKLEPKEIAAKHNISRQAVTERLRRMELSTQAVMVQPQEATIFVNHQIDAFYQLNFDLQKLNKLLVACDEWLSDPHNPEKYDVGPRANEIEVTYKVEIPTEKGYRYETRKEELAALMSVCETNSKGERIAEIDWSKTKHADPRELILKTASEARNTVATAVDLARLMVDVRSMQEFRSAVIKEISKVAPDVAREITETLRRSPILSIAFGGPRTVQPAE